MIDSLNIYLSVYHTCCVYYCNYVRVFEHNISVNEYQLSNQGKCILLIYIMLHD